MNEIKLKDMLFRNFVNLTYMKYHGGHTLDRHVYVSDNEMRKMVYNYNKNTMTKYNSRLEAERCFKEMIDIHSDDIVDWVCNDDSEYLILNTNHDRPVGFGIQTDGLVKDVTSSKAKLVRLNDNKTVLGFYLQTMFPNPNISKGAITQ